MKKFVLLLMSIIILFYNFSVASGIDKLNKFNKNNSSISGDFIQKTTNLKNIQHFSGKFSILRPKYFKWEYNFPYTQIILADGENVWLYDKDLFQVIKQKQKNTLDYSPTAILSDSDNLYKNYTLSDDKQNGDIEYIKAIPKNDDSTYKYVKIGIKKDLIYSIDLQDSFGNNIEIIFKNVYYNNKLNKNQFRFKLPKNVDILEN